MSYEVWGEPDDSPFEAAADAGWIDPTDVSKAMIDVMNERNRQWDEEGFSHDHDDQWTTGHLAYAAASYALEAGSEANSGRGDCPVAGWAPQEWPFDASWWKPKDMRTNLVRAGALILAELERLDRLEEI